MEHLTMTKCPRSAAGSNIHFKLDSAFVVCKYMLTAMRLPVIDAMLQVRVRFVTKVATLKVTEVPIAVPETLGRYGLSEVINHLLGSLPGDADSSEEAAEPKWQSAHTI
jgi:NLE (NUC135) domain